MGYFWQKVSYDDLEIMDDNDVISCSISYLVVFWLMLTRIADLFIEPGFCIAFRTVDGSIASTEQADPVETSMSCRSN